MLSLSNLEFYIEYAEATKLKPVHNPDPNPPNLPGINSILLCMAE